MKNLMFCLLLAGCTINPRIPASKGAKCVILFKTLIAKQAAFETSIEIETTFSNGMLMNLLDTEDGTIGSIFKGISIPKEFDASMKWIDLNTPKRKNLLESIASQKKTTFFEDRNIHGMIIRREVEINFAEDTMLFGEFYTKGSHKVEIGKYFTQVQYGGPRDLTNLRVLELHLRGPFESAEFLRDSRILIKLLKLDVPNLHLHAVAKIPLELLKKRPRIGSMAIANLHRRADLASQILDILTIKNMIAPYQVGDVLFQGTTTPTTITGVARYFNAFANGKRIEMLDDFKMGWVGLHGAGKYDHPDLWGMQFRQLLEEHKISDLMSIIDGVQKRMNDNLKMEIDHIFKWSKNKEINDLASLHYNQSWNRLLEQTQPSIRMKLREKNLREILEEASSENESLKMLIFDWSKDPLFTGNKTKLYQAQLNALNKISQIERVSYRNFDGQLAEVVRDFLIESKIANQVFDSIGASGIL